jgi:hypothetical protein
MSKVKMTFASGLYDRMLALYTGDVKPEIIDLTFVTVDHPRHIFDAQAKGPMYDASEMSASEYITGTARGDRKFVAIPYSLPGYLDTASLLLMKTMSVGQKTLTASGSVFSCTR